MLKFYFILCLCIISCGKTPNPVESTLRRFIGDVVDNELTNDNLIDKYLCKNSPEDKTKADSLIALQIGWLREKLSAVKVGSISYKKYSELTAAAQNSYPDSEIIKDNLIVAYHENKKIGDFLVVNNKINSLGMMNNGGKLFVLKLCRD